MRGTLCAKKHGRGLTSALIVGVEVHRSSSHPETDRASPRLFNAVQGFQTSDRISQNGNIRTKLAVLSSSISGIVGTFSQRKYYLF